MTLSKFPINRQLPRIYILIHCYCMMKDICSWFYPILLSNQYQIFFVLEGFSRLMFNYLPRQMSMSISFCFFLYYYHSLNSMISSQVSLQNNKSTAKARARYLVNIYRVCFYVGAPMLLAKRFPILYLDLMCKTYLNFEVFVLINNSGSVLEHSILNKANLVTWTLR